MASVGVRQCDADHGVEQSRFLGGRTIADTNRAGAPITVDLEQRNVVAYSLLNADAVTCA
jgi:hypothetical protein